MSTRDTAWAPGTPCWVDVAVGDVDSARLFYEGLFDWSVESGPPEFGGYSNAFKKGRYAAGITPQMTAGEPAAWTTYFAVADIDGVAAKVTASGGNVVADPMDVADLGKMALATDPAGAMFGLWQAGKHTGYTIANEPGTVIWTENMSTDWVVNKGFYQRVFGWDYDDMSDETFKYATFQVEGRVAGGLGEIAESADATGAHWSVYFAVEDTDQAVDQAVRLGGSVIRPPWDTPQGRMAIVTDTQGASFALMSAPAEGY